MNSFCKTCATLFGSVLRDLHTRMYFFVDNELCQNKTGDAFHFFYNSFQMLDDFQNLTGPKIRKMMKRTPADS